jgi:hypothetical protein
MPMAKYHILEEIKRTAPENGGSPLGWRRFSVETGIKLDDLYQNSLARYSDACIQAGFAANKLTTARAEAELLEKYANLCLQIGRLPGRGDLRVKAHADKSFPHDATLKRALGTRSELVIKLLASCQTDPNFGAVVELCKAFKASDPAESGEPKRAGEKIGYVYLIKHGSRREYKIGRTNNALRREGEISIELPEKVNPVHVITTDDPAGIEAYWHTRFKDKRKNGEWFELTAADVSSFKRRKFM